MKETCSQKLSRSDDKPLFFGTKKLFCFLLLVFAFVSFLKPTLAIAEGKRTKANEPSLVRMQILEDRSAQLTLSQAVAQKNWMTVDVKSFSGNFSKSAFWAKLEIDPKGNTTGILTLLPAFLDDVQFFVDQKNVLTKDISYFEQSGLTDIRISQQGDFFEFSRRAVDWRGFAVGLQFPLSNELVTVYLRVKTGSSSLIYPDIYSETEFNEIRRSETLYFTILAAITLGAFFLSLAFYALFKEKAFLVYCLYAFCCLSWFVNVNGFTAQFLNIPPQINSNLLGFFICLFLSTGVFFLVLITDLKKHARPVYFAIITSAALIGLLAPLALLGWYRYFAPYLMLLSIIQQSALVLICLWLIWTKRIGQSFALGLYTVTLVCNVVMISGFLGAFIPAHYTIEFLQLIMFVDLMILLPIAFTRAFEQKRSHDFAKQEIELVKKQLQLEQETRDKHRRWTSMITHEIKTPLSVIEACRQSVDSLTSDQQILGRNEKIRRSVERIDDLVSSLLLEDELSERKKAISPQAATPQLIVNFVRQHLSEEVNESVEVIISTKKEQIYVDLMLVNMALHNLLQNAFQHGQPRSKILLSIQDHAMDGRNGLLFTVISAGETIPTEHRAHLFTRNYRFGPAAGSGIGLWATLEIARLHSGDAWYAPSNNETHNVFNIWIPADLQETN